MMFPKYEDKFEINFCEHDEERFLKWLNSYDMYGNHTVYRAGKAPLKIKNRHFGFEHIGDRRHYPDTEIYIGGNEMTVKYKFPLSYKVFFAVWFSFVTLFIILFTVFAIMGIAEAYMTAVPVGMDIYGALLVHFTVKAGVKKCGKLIKEKISEI